MDKLTLVKYRLEEWISAWLVVMHNASSGLDPAHWRLCIQLLCVNVDEHWHDSHHCALKFKVIFGFQHLPGRISLHKGWWGMFEVLLMV